jgi:adenine-specific DNA methylase
MRVIRLSVAEVNSILEEESLMIVRPASLVNTFDEVEDKDFIVYTDMHMENYILSPGSIYIYKVVDIQSPFELEHFSDVLKIVPHGVEYPLKGYVFRFRPFQTKVFLEANTEDPFIFEVDIISDPHESLQLLEDPLTYDPRKVDNIQLVDDWTILTMWYGALIAGEMSVRKKGNQWCVVHGHPKKSGSKTDKPEGSVIKCHPTKEAAERHHKKIIIEQKKREGMTKEQVEDVSEICMREILKRGVQVDVKEEDYAGVLLTSEIVNRLHKTGLYEDYMKGEEMVYEDYVSYPYSYIGSKRRIIEQVLQHVPSSTKLLVDGFAGSGCVSYFARRMGMDVIGVDLSKMSNLVFNSIISNKEAYLSDEEVDALVRAKPVKGYLSTEGSKQVATMKFDSPTKKAIDGFRDIANNLPPGKRELALSVLLTSAGQLCWDGILQFGLSQRVQKMIKKGKKMVDIFRENVRNNARRFNKFVLPDGGRGMMVESDLATFLQRFESIPENSVLYLDPPYISEAKTVSYYTRYDTWENVLFGTPPEDKYGAKWGPKNFKEKMGEILHASQKFPFVLISYKENEMFPIKDMIALFQQYFQYVDVVKIPIKYRLRMKEFNTKQTELLFKLSNAPLETLEYPENIQFESLHDDPNSPSPLVEDPHFILKATLKGKEVSLNLLRQVGSDRYSQTIINLGTPHFTKVSDTPSLSREPDNYTEARKMFVSELWEDIKASLSDPRMKFFSVPIGGYLSFSEAIVEGYMGGDDVSTYEMPVAAGTYTVKSSAPGHRVYSYSGEVLRGDFAEHNLSQMGSAEDLWVMLSCKDAPVVDSNLELPHEAFFSLQEVRNPLSTDYMFNLVFGGETYVFSCETDPLSTPSLATLSKGKLEDVLTEDFKMLHKDYLSYISMVDKGTCQITKFSPNEIDITLTTEKLQGVVTFVENNGLWSVVRHIIRDNTPFTEDFTVRSSKKIGSNRLEIEGLLFREGFFKGRTFKRNVVKGATLDPLKRGSALAYVNMFHQNKEVTRIGLITDIWWDEEAEWRCSRDNQTHTGALMFKAVITDPQGIEAIMSNNIYQVSAELGFDVDREDNPTYMIVSGVAICHTPAVESAQIHQACQGDTCMTFPTSVIPQHLSIYT